MTTLPKPKTVTVKNLKVPLPMMMLMMAAMLIQLQLVLLFDVVFPSLPSVFTNVEASMFMSGPRSIPTTNSNSNHGGLRGWLRGQNSDDVQEDSVLNAVENDHVQNDDLRENDDNNANDRIVEADPVVDSDPEESANVQIQGEDGHPQQDDSAQQLQGEPEECTICSGRFDHVYDPPRGPMPPTLSLKSAVM
jgi:hypothetical protein